MLPQPKSKWEPKEGHMKITALVDGGCGSMSSSENSLMKGGYIAE